MRQNAKKVCTKFEAGKSGSGDSKRTIWTDGQRIYSYAMPIAARTFMGGVAIINYSDGPSRTTRSHIRACQSFFPSAHVLPAAIPKAWR